MTTQQKNIQTLAAYSIPTNAQFFMKGGGLPAHMGYNDPNIQGDEGKDTFDKTFTNSIIASDRNLKKGIQKLSAFGLSIKATEFVKGGGLPVAFGSKADPNMHDGGEKDAFNNSNVNGIIVSDHNLKKGIQKLSAFGLSNKEASFLKGGGLPAAILENKKPKIQGRDGNTSGVVVSDRNLKKNIQKLEA